MPALPPGAMDAGPTDARAPPLPRTPSSALYDRSYYASPPNGTPSHDSQTTGGMSEFGLGYSPSAYSSASRRPLPAQPLSGMPTSPYPASTSSGSISGRRSLPTPPSVPAPPPRPAGRQLPTIPPVPHQARIPSSSRLPDVPAPPPPARPLPPTQPYMPTNSRIDDTVSRQSSYRAESASNDSPSSMACGTSDDSHQYSSSRHTSIYGSSSSASHLIGGLSTETGRTSVPSTESIYESYGKPDPIAPDITLRPPSQDPLRTASPNGQETSDGRRTPTATSWTLELEPPSMAHLELGSRRRTTSNATINAVDANLPSTPTASAAPHRVLQHQRSFLDTRGAGADNSRPDSVSFPVPQPAHPNGPSGGSSTLREDIENMPGPLHRGPSMPRPNPDMFPDSHERVPQRRRSQTSSIRSSIASSERPRSLALSVSWSQQQQQPSNWVQTKLQIHQSHVEDELYDEENGYRRASNYEEDILDGYDDEEEGDAEEVNEIRFFQPAFLSEAALQLRDRVERRRQMKAGIAWIGSFTGRDIVVSVSNTNEGMLIRVRQLYPAFFPITHEIPHQIVEPPLS